MLNLIKKSDVKNMREAPPDETKSPSPVDFSLWLMGSYDVVETVYRQLPWDKWSFHLPEKYNSTLLPIDPLPYSSN